MYVEKRLEKIIIKKKKTGEKRKEEKGTSTEYMKARGEERIDRNNNKNKNNQNNKDPAYYGRDQRIDRWPLTLFSLYSSTQQVATARMVNKLGDIECSQTQMCLLQADRTVGTD